MKLENNENQTNMLLVAKTNLKLMLLLIYDYVIEKSSEEEIFYLDSSETQTRASEATWVIDVECRNQKIRIL